MKDKEFKFRAVLQDAGGGGVFVEFPYDAQKEFGKGRVPVKCTIDGEPYTGSLVKYGSPHHILPVLKSIRAKIKKTIGQEVIVCLVEDTDERKMVVPPDFMAALKKHKLLERFEKLSYSFQRESVQWIEGAKKHETRLKRIVKMMEKLGAGK